MPADYAALERARLARDPRDFLAPVSLPPPARAEPRGKWCVVRRFEDGRPDQPIRLNMVEDAAAKLAGELRDAMSEEQIATGGYNILARNGSTGFTFTNGKDRAASRQARYSFGARSNATPEQAAAQRSEHARKAGRASWRNR